MSTLDLATLVPDQFTPLTGRTFRMVPAQGDPVDVELWKVRVPSRKPPRGFRQPFALEFKPPPGALLPQGIYRLENEALGVMEVMVTPVLASPGVCHYEAVFG